MLMLERTSTCEAARLSQRVPNAYTRGGSNCAKKPIRSSGSYVQNQVVITRNYRATSPRNTAAHTTGLFSPRAPRDFPSIVGKNWKLYSEPSQSNTVAV